MDDPSAGGETPVARLLRTAELWARAPRAREPELVVGWEDSAPYCSAVCTTDVGLAFCRRCPVEVAGRAIDTRRAVSGVCPAGVPLLAFPAPRGARGRAAVLRIGRPGPGQAGSVAELVRVSPRALRSAAGSGDRHDGRTVLAAAHVLRSRASVHRWQVEQRELAANRRRTATAALAQMIATSEDLQLLYGSAQRQRAELARQQRRLDRLAREAFRSQGVERARVAHQIHDTAAQSMVSAYRFLDAARSAAIAGRPATAGSHLDAAGERLQAAIGEVRAVMANLLPPGLEELGVGRALDGWLGRLTAGSGVGFRVSGEIPHLDGWVEQALYGMAAEAASNAFRHARASSIRVELGTRAGRAVVVVSDDGRGFDASGSVARRRGEGLGLLGMRRQAAWLGGRATIRSAPGHGTVVRISIPLGTGRADRPDGATRHSATSAQPDGADRARRPIRPARRRGE